MKKFTFLFVSFLVLFSGVVFLTFSISAKLMQYHAKRMEMAETLNFEQRLMNVWEWVPYNTEGEKKVAIWQNLENESNGYYQSALVLGGGLAALVILFVISNLMVYRKKTHRFQVYGLVMVFASLSFLYLGLQSPFLEIEAYNKDLAFEVPIDVKFNDMPLLGDLGLGNYAYNLDQTFEGRTYYLYQNKSILQLIVLLYTGGNFLVAIALLVFSIIFPITKLLISIVVFLNPHTSGSKKAMIFVEKLGKWSMADVFVASIFLAYFSFTNMNVGVDTGATTLIGTYFFIAFVVLSIASGAMFNKITKISRKVHHNQNDIGLNP